MAAESIYGPRICQPFCRRKPGRIAGALVRRREDLVACASFGERFVTKGSAASWACGEAPPLPKPAHAHTSSTEATFAALAAGQARLDRSSMATPASPEPFKVWTNDRGEEGFLHGTKAELKPGDLIEPGRSSNYGNGGDAAFVDLTATLDAATWVAALALGDGRGRIYVVEPTGPFPPAPGTRRARAPTWRGHQHVRGGVWVGAGLELSWRGDLERCWPRRFPRSGAGGENPQHL